MFTQKGMTKKFLKMMEQLENACCSGQNPFGIAIEDSDSFDFSGNGKTGSPLTGVVKISATDGNIITINPDGLYAIGGGGSEFAAEDTDTIDVNGAGTSGDPLTLDLKVSADNGNQLVTKTDGAFFAQNIWEVESIAAMAALDTSLYDTVLVRNVGIFKHSNASLTNDGYSTVTGVTGFWVLNNAAIIAPKKQGGIELGKVLPGTVTGSLENITKNGAMTTAVITQVNGYDNFVVTGGSRTSWVRFNSLLVQDNVATVKARIKLDNIGTTSPFVGIGFAGYNSSHDTTATVWDNDMIINLLDNTVVHQFLNGSVTTNIGQASTGTFAVNGDIIEIELTVDSASSSVKATFMNVATSEYVVATHVNVDCRNLSCFSHAMRLTLADGTYTLLELSAKSSVPKNNFLSIVGDSYGCGDLLKFNTSLVYVLQQSLPQYDIACHAGNGAYQVSMAKYQLSDIIKLKPRFVLFMQILNVYNGFYDDGTADQVEFDTNNVKMLDAITLYGGRPILVKWQTTGGFINAGVDGNTAAGKWATKVDALVAAYPTSLVLDLSGAALQLNNNSHPTIVDTQKMRTALIELLKTNGII